MSTFDYLIDHARRNVWCSPEQDFQVIFAPQKISPINGSRSTIEVLWTQIPLPTNNDWYHVYQVGEITPELLGLQDKKSVWMPASRQCNDNLLIIDLYVRNGLQFPRFDCYFLMTRDGNVLLAVKEQPKIADLNVEPLYVRFYSNAYFNRPDYDAAVDGIQVVGRKIANSDQQYALQRQWRDSKLRKGATYAFVNGYRVQDINPTTVKVGDNVEFVWDSSIKCVLELPVKDLPVFLSTLDNKQKYLVHYPGAQVGGDIIDYRDDLDFWLLLRTNENIFSGVYYHKNKEDAVRMMSHRDYSLVVPYVLAYTNSVPGWTDASKLTLQIHIREAGFKRPLINEHHRIKELYKLSDEDLVKAMIGTDSTVSVWTAASLESSAYPAIMRNVGGDITRQMVQDAYGYNAISKLIADTPQPYTPSENWVELPVGLRSNSTIYEYDKDGVLLDWYQHTSGRYYPPRDANCRLIEGIVGLGGPALTTQYNTSDTMLDPAVNYRFYVCNIWNGVPDGKWVDVTGNDDYYIVQDNAVLWKVDQTKYYTAIKNDSEFLAYDLILDYRDGILRFTVNVDEVRTDGVLYPDKAEIPFGAFDIWLNGRPLIQDLDYFINGWPEICIVNKEYLVDGTAQRISLRGTGFCNADMTQPAPAEFGFVNHGLLSQNNRFDIRDDKVIRIVVDGGVYERSVLEFSEEHSGVTLALAGVRNGAPYQIQDLIVPLQGLTDEDTYSLRAKSLVVDKEISDYMTLKLPQPTFDNPNPIPQLYAIYSPFTSKLMYDLYQGILKTDDVEGQYSDVYVKQKLAPYEWLLAYEPTYRDMDWEYVSVHPHNLFTEVTLNVYAYRLMLRAIKLYLNDKVDITKFIKIETGFEHETPDHPHPYRVLP